MQRTNETKPLAEEYLMREIDQAWSHYRHLEEMRFKYLSLLIGLLGTSAAALIAAFQILLRNNVTPAIGVGLPCIVLLLYGFAQLLQTAIIRIGYVLLAYEDIMYQTRAHFCGVGSYAFDLWRIRTRIGSSMSGNLFSLQRNAVVLLSVVCGSLGLVEAALLWSLWGQPNHLLRVIPAMSVLLIFGLGGHVALADRKAQRDRAITSDSVNRHFSRPLTSAHDK